MNYIEWRAEIEKQQKAIDQFKAKLLNLFETDILLGIYSYCKAHDDVCLKSDTGVFIYNALTSQLVNKHMEALAEMHVETTEEEELATINDISSIYIAYNLAEVDKHGKIFFWLVSLLEEYANHLKSDM